MVVLFLAGGETGLYRPTLFQPLPSVRPTRPRVRVPVLLQPGTVWIRIWSVYPALSTMELRQRTPRSYCSGFL